MKIFICVMLLLSALNVLAAPASATVVIEGMTCSSCARAIERGFKKIPEVEAVKISLSAETVTLIYKEGKNLTPDQIKSAIKETGFSVKSAESTAESKQ